MEYYPVGRNQRHLRRYDGNRRRNHILSDMFQMTCFYIGILILRANFSSTQETEDNTWVECQQVLQNEGVDAVADRIVSSIKENISDRVSLSDDPGTFIDENEGYIEGLQKVEKDGSASGSCSDAGVLQLTVPLVFRDLNGNYKWETKVFSLSGDHTFTIEKITGNAHFSVIPVPRAEQLESDMFKDISISGIEKKVTGMGFLNSFASRLASFYGNNISRAWRRLLLPALENAIRDAAAGVTLTFQNESNDIFNKEAVSEEEILISNR